MVKLARRMFLYFSGLMVLGTFLFKKSMGGLWADNSEAAENSAGRKVEESDRKSYVYMVRNDSPENNTRKLIEMMGGTGEFIGPDDIVLLKPNAQWWNQGATNTNAMKAFIEMVVELPGFHGEVIIADNHHFPENNSRGWTTEKRNGDFNLNELVAYFQDRGQRNVTRYHWHDGGPSIKGLWGGAENGGVINGPEDGDGYVWKNDLVYTSPSGRKAMMSYPVFTSRYSGITIDFMRGPWKDGHYLKRKMKFINFSGLNHHGSTGVTASIKNYLGICDMTCGHRGKKPEGYYNFHFVGGSNFHWRLKAVLEKFGWNDYLSSIGGCVGYFMRNVRMADLNIVEAEWVGYGSKSDSRLRVQTKAMLASVDPVALDYTAAKEVLLPATHENTKETKFIVNNDPDSQDSPFREFLRLCHEQGIGNFDEQNIVKIRSG
jgi:hypothetical protein